MTKKVFDEIAQVILDATSVRHENAVVKDILVNRLADIFKTYNKRFDQKKFIMACYHQSEKYSDNINQKDMVRLLNQVS